MLLAVLTIGAVSASEDVAFDELAVSDEVADVQLPQEDFDDLSMDNSTVFYPLDDGEEGDDPYNVEVVDEFDVNDQSLAIINITCPVDEQNGYFVFKTLNDDWRELYSYTYVIKGSDHGNVIHITPQDLGITEPGGYIVLIYCAEDPEDLQEDEEIFEAHRGIEAIDYSQFRYVSLDTFRPNALLMGDVFAVYCPDGSSGTVIVDVRKEDDDEFFQSSAKDILDKDDENMLYWSLSELEIYGKDGRYSFNVYHIGSDGSYEDIRRDEEIELVSPISIASSSYINSTIRGGLVLVEIPSNFEDGEILFMINGEEIFTKSLDEFVAEGGNSPYWRYGDGYGGPDENWKYYCIDNYHFAYDFENGNEYVIGAILTLNGQSPYLFTEEAEVRMIERNIVSDGDYSIEIFGENGYIFEEWTYVIVITAPEDSEGTVEIWADDYDGWSWEGSLGDLSGFDEEEGQYWILPEFFEDLGHGDYVICVAYNDEDGNRVIDNSGYIEFYREDDEDGPIEDIELSLNAEDEEEPKFEISDSEIIAYLLIPDNEEFDGTAVTVNVTRNGNDFAAFNTDEMEYEIDDVKKAKKYPIVLDLTQLGDKDLLSIALDCFDEEVWAYGIEIDEDTAIFHWYEEMIDSYVFVGNITTGDFNDPNRMGPHPDGRFIELAIPDAFNVSEGSIVVDDGSGTIIEKSFDDFEDVQYRYEVLGNSYMISLDDFDLMNLPENRNITVTLNFESDSLTFKRIRHGDYLAQVVTPDDVAKSYDININDDVMTSKEDIAVDIVGIDANPQSIWMDVGEGQFNVYVNDEKVEGLGRLIYENWLYLSGVLDADEEELRDMDIAADDIDMPLEEFAELSREEKIQILNDTFKSDYPDDITLFRLTSFRHGCPELHISLADLNITASGEYNIKVTHIPGDPEDILDPDYLPDYSTEIVETLVLEKTITVQYNPSPFISADSVTTQYGKDVNVTVNLFKDVRGNVWFTINGKTDKAPITNGVATYTVSGLKYGLYTVDIRYRGSAKYADDTITTSLKVNKLSAPIVSVSAENIGFNEDATVLVNVAKKVNGNIHITVNNVTKAAPITNGVATATFSGLERGTYEVTALYKGTANILSKTKTTTFKVVKGTPIISVDAPDAGYGSDAVITVNLGNRANGNVHITINGVTGKAPITNGIATYSISGLKRGTYDVNVMYKGSTNYNAQNYTTTLNVVKGTPITSISVKNNYVGRDTTIAVKMASNVNGFVKITVNGATERVQIVNGVATAKFSGLKAGTYDVSAVYAGNANFDAQKFTSNLTVNKLSPGISILKSTVDGNPMITVKLAEDAPGNVWIKVNGSSYRVPISNGVASISLPNLKSGSHEVVATYNGNYKYLAQTKTRTVSVK
ncbi:hypothetical protein TL18_03335 [Methanobrevibacter sp. YE315]|nr:hypothetical protein TL18_03335 [Methanobrevibacter sp. YE315]